MQNFSFNSIFSKFKNNTRIKYTMKYAKIFKVNSYEICGKKLRIVCFLSYHFATRMSY